MEVNDTNLSDSLFDLRVGPSERPDIAIECVAAVDPVRTETWNVGPAKGPLFRDLSSNWMVSLGPETNFKAIRKEIETILKLCEEEGLKSYHVAHRRPWLDDHILDSFERLGIEGVFPAIRSGRGRIDFSMTGVGGAIDSFGESLPGWIGEFLSSVDRSDVISKLTASKTARRHVFVAVEFGGAPWPVESYLTNGLKFLPSNAPRLPDPIDEIWIASIRSEFGLRWTGSKWVRFLAQGPGITK